MRKAAETVDLNPARWLGVREEVPGKMVKYFRLSGQLKSAVQSGSGSVGAAGCCAAAEGRGGLPASPRIPLRRCVRSTADPGCSPPRGLRASSRETCLGPPQGCCCCRWKTLLGCDGGEQTPRRPGPAGLPRPQPPVRGSRGPASCPRAHGEPSVSPRRSRWAGARCKT